ncbi:LINE-1 reverse transcriptase isogeny [Senna tora]|uniref:LINE-1 reverse transcriptase isogeny n=1 Tax=Senna tora TaxID=362788 RepID=A0A834W2P5_9FABA|nr:LINE-1 reverse transcriptase isogeny [Senna tora]
MGMEETMQELTVEETDQVERSSKKVKTQGVDEMDSEVAMAVNMQGVQPVPGGEMPSGIGNLIGKTLKVDPMTSLTNKGKFSRICVEINLKRQLVPQVEKEAETREQQQPVDLNMVPSKVVNEGENDGGANTDAAEERQGAENGNNGIFGPWMVDDGDQNEDTLGSGMIEGFVEGWSTDPAERMVRTSLKGKGEIVDKARLLGSPVLCRGNRSMKEIEPVPAARPIGASPIMPSELMVAGHVRQSKPPERGPKHRKPPAKQGKGLSNDGVAYVGAASFNGDNVSVSTSIWSKSSVSASQMEVEELVGAQR